jgi:alpha-L-fucosidase
MKKRVFILSILFCCSLWMAQAQQRAQWMQEARWGIMSHYLADWMARSGGFGLNVAKWNEMVNNFDVEGLADQLQKIGAKYYIISIGQNSGYYLAPNPVYDRLTGISPGKCSQRDLVADLSKALHERGIRLIVYLPSGAPAGDKEAVKALEWTNGPYPNIAFQQKWEQVIAWWSSNWGDAIDGWWFDGCYWPNTMYRSVNEPNFGSFARAARTGNPANIVGFNPGVVNRTISMTPYEDYIAGEISDPTRMSIMRVYNGLVDGNQLHILSYLGEKWGMGSPRFTVEQIVGWSQQVIKAKGAITWDVPVQINGLIPEAFMQQLTELGKELK